MDKKGFANKLIFVFPVLFIIEMALGFTGTMIMVDIFGKSMPIRHILFLGSFASLYGYCLYYVIRYKVKIFSLKDKDSVFGSFGLLGWSLALFIVSSLVSIFVIPQFSGSIGGIDMAFDEMMDALAVMSLYYPVFFMMKWGKLRIERFDTLINYVVALLSVEHIFLYIGETMHGGFIVAYMKFLKALFWGTSLTPDVILGSGGYPRVIYTTSILLILGMYVLVKNFDRLRVHEYIFLALDVVALLTTMTRSIWVGIFCGLFLFIPAYCYLQIRKGTFQNVKRMARTVVGGIIMVVILNFTMFNNFVFLRLANSLTTGQAASSMSVNSNSNWKDIEKYGSSGSVAIKSDQTKALLEKWQKRPIFGFGYGSYAETCIRSTTSKFSYEMQAPALLMKVGIAGIACWVFLFFSMLFTVWKRNRKSLVTVFAWVFGFLAFGISAQTNPLLLSYTGMGVILFFMFQSAAPAAQAENIEDVKNES